VATTAPSLATLGANSSVSAIKWIVVSDQSGQALSMSRCRAALVLVRTFLGLVYLTNGLAKLFEFHSVVLGPWKTFLIDRGDAFGIQSGNTSSSPGFLHDIGLVIVANWGNFQFLLTFAELAVGLALLLGLLSRLTILGGFLLAFSTFIFTLGAETWMFDYLFEPVLFLVLAIAPPLPGLDSRMPWGRPRRQS
jgi:uncharacterized membrane protein YphA (DoxX/SURF4 family)